LGHPCKFQQVSRLGSVTAWHSSSGRQPNFAALNRGRHLYSAGRPSRWAFAHILVMAALCNRGAIIFLPCSFFSSFYLSFFSSPNLSGRRLDVYHTLTHGVAPAPSANLECRSEMCCTRLAANAGPKKVAKNRHLGTIAQLCRAISLQLTHVSTMAKKLVKRNISSTCPHKMVNFGPLAAEIVSLFHAVSSFFFFYFLA